MDIAVVVGNPKPQSRTLTMATELGRSLASSLGADPDVLVVDLAANAREMFDPDSPTLRALGASLTARRLLVVASPTFKGSYTGLLKSFFDRFESESLRGVVGVAAMTGAAHVHALAVEVHLRPLLVELGATVPARGLYVTESDLTSGAPVGAAWLESALPLLRRATTGD